MNNPFSRPVQVALPPAVAGAVGSAGAAYVVPAPAPILPAGVRGGGGLSPSSATAGGRQVPVPISSRPAIASPVTQTSAGVPISRVGGITLPSALPTAIEARPNVLFVPTGVVAAESSGGLVPPGGKVGSASQRPVAEFLFHLMKMLTDPTIQNLIEWTNGRIRVHDPHTLENEVLGKYFRHSKYSSFQRQLNYFGFRKVGSKGRMSPCSFVNDSCTLSLASILSIKRRTASKSKKRKERSGDASSAAGDEQEENQGPSEKMTKTKKTDAPPLADVPFAVTADEFGPPGSFNLPAAVSPISSAAASTAGYQTDGDSTQASSLPGMVLQPILPAPATAAAARLIASNSSAAAATTSWEDLDGSQSDKDAQQQQQEDDVGGSSPNDTATLAMIDQYLGDICIPANCKSSGSGSGSGTSTPAAMGETSQLDLAALATELGFGAPLQQQQQQSQAEHITPAGAATLQAALALTSTTTTSGGAAAPTTALNPQQQSLLMTPSVPGGRRTYAPVVVAPPAPEPTTSASASSQPAQQQEVGVADAALSSAATAAGGPLSSCPITPKMSGLLKSRSSQDFMKDFFETFQSPGGLLATPSLQNVLGQATPMTVQALAQGDAPGPGKVSGVMDNVKLPNLMQ